MTHGKKRKCDQSLPNVDEELIFEKKPRQVPNGSEEFRRKNVKSRPLLPIKVATGKLISQEIQVEEPRDKESSNESETDDLKNIPVEPTIPINTLGIANKRKRQISNVKRKIAKLSSAIMTDPQANIKLLKQLRLMLEDVSMPESLVTTRKLVMASLTCLFVDIIPGYRIRERTEKEKEVKLSKEVKILTTFEEGLLHQYKSFLQFLEKTISARYNQGKSRLLSTQSQESLGQMAIESLCELYKKTAHFNFHNNIIVVLVPIANDDFNPEVRKMCCDAMSLVFSTDKLGVSTLATTKAIAKVAKERGPKKLQIQFLNTLFTLRINKVDYSMVTHRKTKAERKKAKEVKKKMSRRDVKQMKKQKHLENELKEAAASEDQEKRTQLHTETLQQVFLVYFRILKHKHGEMVECRHVLPSVLEGLAKFAHLINIDFHGDLLTHLEVLVECSELSLREKLHCIFTSFQILSGQGEVLNVDPAKFYSVMFSLVNELPFHTKAKIQSSAESNVDVMINCLEMMLNKRRKQVTATTLKSYIKRLTTMCLQLHPRFPVKLLGEIRSLFNTNSKSASLLDTESSHVGDFYGELDDPERNGSNSAVLWEFHLLNRHYVPLVGQTAMRVLKEFAT